MTGVQTCALPISKHGYRFSGPIAHVQEKLPAQHSGAKWLLVVSGVLVVAAVIAYYVGNRIVHTLTAMPLTTYPGDERQPALSPDGNQVAFSWNGMDQRNYDIYVKVIGAESPLRLTTDEAEDFSPSWSPDGHWIAFLRRLSDARAALILI